MKKTLTLLFLAFVLIGCGKNYETYTETQMKEMYDIAYKEKKAGNSEKMDYIEELQEKLAVAAKDGDKVAAEQKELWVVTKMFHYEPQDSKKFKVDLKNRLW